MDGADRGRVGRVVRWGSTSLNLSLQGFYNLEESDNIRAAMVDPLQFSVDVPEGRN